jgi:hypothetical protein
MRPGIALAVSIGGLVLGSSVVSPAAAPEALARPVKAVAWQQWRHVTGVTDVTGPRSRDTRFVVSANGHLFLLRPSDGRLSHYPTSGAAYSANPTLEPYTTVAGPRQVVASPRCRFPRDTVYAIVPARPTAVLAITPAGRISQLAAISGVASLNGITFDTGGRFGGRLLVVGLTDDGHGALVSVDCRGRTRTLTTTAPHLEGGLVVAPAGFGTVGGDLLAPDELQGRVLVLGPDGSVRDLITPVRPAGPDIGVESLGFVPSPLRSAYVADRLVPGNANPGQDQVLRLTSGQLRGVGVQSGDLLVALEGGGKTLDVRCAPSCRTRVIGAAPSGAHVEGSISFG